MGVAGDSLPGALAETANYGNAKGIGYPGDALGPPLEALTLPMLDQVLATTQRSWGLGSTA